MCMCACCQLEMLAFSFSHTDNSFLYWLMAPHSSPQRPETLYDACGQLYIAVVAADYRC